MKHRGKDEKIKHHSSPEREVILEEIMAENIHKLMENCNDQIQD